MRPSNLPIRRMPFSKVSSPLKLASVPMTVGNSWGVASAIICSWAMRIGKPNAGFDRGFITCAAKLLQFFGVTISMENLVGGRNEDDRHRGAGIIPCQNEM